MKHVTVLTICAVVFLAGPVLLAAEPASESEKMSEAPMQKMHSQMNMKDMEMQDKSSHGMTDDMPCQRMVAMQDRHHDMQEHRQMMQKMMDHMTEHESMQEEPSE